ncbi:hypothetical protein [Nocardia sp. NPDC052566]|uniref:hypothetical protein n=1 Tax=Nocardia sp. NPDC052566 TaxID=3364330 RepID=UPI0037CC2170
MMRRIAILVAVAALLTSCGIFSQYEQDRSPGLPRALGARVTAGELRIWMGARCFGSTHLTFLFHPSETSVLLVADNGDETEFEYVTLGLNPGWTISKPLPAGFDWTKEKRFTFSGSGQGGHSDIETIMKDSAAHPDDTYWFEDVGWLNPVDLAAKDGKTFLAACSPNPKP